MKTLEPWAEEAGLIWVTDQMPGIRRIKHGKSFSYRLPNGRPVRDAKTLARIRALVIPPAWRDVWICPLPRGHIQAIGRDARGRRQYRYHAEFRAVRDADKYQRLDQFGRLLPRLRRRLRRDLARPHLPREKVLATVIQLLERTLIRIGNDEYARQNGSYGLTTLQDRHAKIRGGRVRFRFRGKSGKEHEIEVDDPKLAKIVKRCQELPGQELFQYMGDDGRVHDIGSSDVNEYLREVTGGAFTAKDFRTWAGTVAAAKYFASAPCLNQAASKREIAACMKQVAERLGNTPAVCRKSYVHPAVLDAFTEGELAGLTVSEAAVLQLLKKHRSA